MGNIEAYHQYVAAFDAHAVGSSDDSSRRTIRDIEVKMTKLCGCKLFVSKYKDDTLEPAKFDSRTNSVISQVRL